jgi:hypothetical protein
MAGLRLANVYDNYAAGSKRRGMELPTPDPSAFVFWVPVRTMVDFAMSSLSDCAANLMCRLML